jgi:hypothetical protein
MINIPILREGATQGAGGGGGDRRKNKKEQAADFVLGKIEKKYPKVAISNAVRCSLLPFLIRSNNNIAGILGLAR